MAADKNTYYRHAKVQPLNRAGNFKAVMSIDGTETDSYDRLDKKTFSS